jgi:RHS repeat-associated protein
MTNLTLGLTETRNYDGASRLTALSAKHNDTEAVMNYSYQIHSSLLGTVRFQAGGATRLTTDRTYDALPRLTSVTSSSPTLPEPVSYTYRFNNVNQRTGMTNTDGSYWLYTYDTLGQVTDARRYWPGGSQVLGQSFTYKFDDIGNLTRTETGGDATGSQLRAAHYSANALNQYLQRALPGYLEANGSAAQDAEVTVNRVTAERQGAYFRSEVLLTNDGQATIQGVATLASRPDRQTTVSRFTQVPASPEQFTHDLDGNLAGDGLWNYRWDGENRLIRMELKTNEIADSSHWRRIDCDYDFQGRRVRKRVLAWDPLSGSYQPSRSLRYFYDGWNLVGQVDEITGQRLSFVWGNDLSGTPGSAGGIGGLLAMTVHLGVHAGTYFYGYDGLGNARVLVRADDGSEAARYAYGPFGEPTQATGPLALVNPFRFSTKYHDEETGLIYYGYRFYNPSTGRWLSRDPIGHRGGLNLYGFTENNPVNQVDPLGLALYAFDGTGQTFDSGTAVAILASGYDGKVEYETGVGTGNVAVRAIGGITGTGGKNRVSSMYRKFLENHAAGDTEVDIIGFSRGAALAREFANLLHERGYQSRIRTRNGSIRTGKRCPVNIRFIGLFDTVGSFGIPGNHINLGMRLNLPPNVRRALFPYTPLNPARQGQVFVEQSFPGDHSDIGGGHGDDNNLLSIAPSQFIEREGTKAGAPFTGSSELEVRNNRNPHDLRGLEFTLMTHLLYNTSPVSIRLRGGFTSPTQERNFR